MEGWMEHWFGIIHPVGASSMVHMVALWLWPEHRKESPLQPATLGRKYYKKILVNHQQFTPANEEKQDPAKFSIRRHSHARYKQSYFILYFPFVFITVAYDFIHSTRMRVSILIFQSRQEGRIRCARIN